MRAFSDGFVMGDDDELAALAKGSASYDVRSEGPPKGQSVATMTDNDLAHLSDAYGGTLAETMYAYSEAGATHSGGVDLTATASLFDGTVGREVEDQTGLAFNTAVPTGGAYSMDAIVALGGGDEGDEDAVDVGEGQQPMSPTIGVGGGRLALQLQTPQTFVGYDSQDAASSIYRTPIAPGTRREQLRAHTDPSRYSRADASALEEMRQLTMDDLATSTPAPAPPNASLSRRDEFRLSAATARGLDALEDSLRSQIEAGEQRMSASLSRKKDERAKRPGRIKNYGGMD